MSNWWRSSRDSDEGGSARHRAKQDARRSGGTVPPYPVARFIRVDLESELRSSRPLEGRVRKSWRFRMREPLPPPAVLPDFLADQTGDARLVLGQRHHRARGRAVGDFKQQLGPDRLLELVAILDRHHERTGSSDHAILVVEIEVVDIHRRI